MKLLRISVVDFDADQLWECNLNVIGCLEVSIYRTDQ